jgi:Tfp pilus assembly protein PilV
MFTARRKSLRGVSLVEALVALAVMAFGMLAIVGIQSTMRLNADVSRQRSEAVRIGQEALERWRAFSVLDTTAGRTAYADISTPADEVVAGYTTNTSYTLARAVTDVPLQNHKELRVTVSWLDRSDTAQSVVFNSVIAGIDPALFGAIATTPAGNPSKRPRNRHASIPPGAKDMGGGLSAFKPPVPGAGGNVAWVFNNTTGFITGVCFVATTLGTQDLTTVDIAGCSDNTLAQLLSGYVRFSTGTLQPTAADAETPLSTARNLDLKLTLTSTGHAEDPTCFDDAPTTAVAASGALTVSYFCAIPSNTTRSWSGYATVTPLPFSDVTNSDWSIPLPNDPTGTHRLCRYTPAASDTDPVPNWQHPRLYGTEFADPLRQQVPLPMPPLPNQNFLVVLEGFSCPTDVAADPVAANFINSNTLLHTPWPP